MNRAELIEKAAEDIELFGSGIDARHAAKIIIDSIFAAMREPTEAMFDAGKQSRKAGNSVYGNSRSTWQAMLSASPLAPEGGGT